MRTRRIVMGAAALAAVVVLAGAGAPEAAMKFPAYLMVRGGDLEEPVVIHHGMIPMTFADGEVRSGGALLLLYGGYGGTTTSAVRDPGDLPPVVTYEVAEFFDAEDWELAREGRLPAGGLRFEDATFFTTWHRTEGGGPIWWERGEPPFRSFRVLGPQARRALRAVGLDWR